MTNMRKLEIAFKRYTLLRINFYREMYNRLLDNITSSYENSYNKEGIDSKESYLQKTEIYQTNNIPKRRIRKLNYRNN